jgi:8-oxo-dGTP diphosphatase
MSEHAIDSIAMRATVDSIVARIDPYDALEQEHREATRRWLASGTQFTRLIPPDVPPQHLVSYVVLVDPEAGQLLLTDHLKSRLWLPGGGHVEPGEHPRTTAARELAEEMNLAADFMDDAPLFLTVTRTTSGIVAVHTDVSLWYVCRASAHTPITFDRGEFVTICWFALDDIPWERTDPHMHRFVAKLRAYLATR